MTVNCAEGRFIDMERLQGFLRHILAEKGKE